jgi:multimeric flavodoxin WrbA
MIKEETLKKVKKIIGLSCGRKNGNCDTLLKSAAMGAEEFGIETEIIRAMSLKVLPCTGCWACRDTHKCILKDDVDWILEKTVMEDYGLIVSVPCYHVRANGYFMCISERMNHTFTRDFNSVKKTRVGGIIGVGGSGYDAWTSLNKSMVNLFVQHTRLLVDQIQVNYCGIKQWNLWDREDNTPVMYKTRIQDIPYQRMLTIYGPQDAPDVFYQKSVDRARQLGRNVAKAMLMPIEKVKYVGEESGVSCPVCHCNVVTVPEDLPHVACPVCYVRGTVTTDKNGKMKVKWNKADTENSRFSYEGVIHHGKWMMEGGRYRQKYQANIAEKIKSFANYGNIIKPE